MEEDINLVLHAWVIIERIAVEVAKLKDVPLESGASEGYGNVGFDKDNISESYEALKMLHKEDNIFIVYIFSYWHYLTFSVYPIEMEVKVA